MKCQGAGRPFYGRPACHRRGKFEPSYRLNFEPGVRPEAPIVPEFDTSSLEIAAFRLEVSNSGDRGLLSLDNVAQLTELAANSARRVEFIRAVPARRYGELGEWIGSNLLTVSHERASPSTGWWSRTI